jgi:hypothetical protein
LERWGFALCLEEWSGGPERGPAVVDCRHPAPGLSLIRLTNAATRQPFLGGSRLGAKGWGRLQVERDLIAFGAAAPRDVALS